GDGLRRPRRRGWGGGRRRALARGSRPAAQLERGGARGALLPRAGPADLRHGHRAVPARGHPRELLRRARPEAARPEAGPALAGPARTARGPARRIYGRGLARAGGADQTRPVITACFTPAIAFVTWMPRGQASVQLKVVRQRHTPSLEFRISRRCSPASSRESKMKRCALTIAAGPKYCPSVQNTGHEEVHAAHRMHLVVSSKRSRCSADCRRSRLG